MKSRKVTAKKMMIQSSKETMNSSRVFSQEITKCPLSNLGCTSVL